MITLTWEGMNAAVVNVCTCLSFCLLLLRKHTHDSLLAVSVTNITSIQSYYHSLLFPKLFLSVLFTLSDGRILMWEGRHLASVDTGYLCG
jgi:hypothetical protein